MLILASASPRRRELLALLCVPFTVAVSAFDEEALKAQVPDPAQYVREAALGKARDVATRHAGLILGCDTDVVSPDGAILSKPVDAADAKRMLRALSGKTHSVYSGVALLESDGTGNISRQETRTGQARVTFGDLPDAAIDAYVATGDPLDKAGAYGIQSGALAFVTHIEGDVSSIIGLPLPIVRELLTAFGFPLWQTAA